MQILYLGLGGLLALLSTRWLAHHPPARELKGWAAALVLVSGACVAFAVATGAGDWIGLELAGMFLFAGIAYAGVRFAPALLSLGWSARAFWDLAHFMSDDAIFIPGRYALAWIGYDLVVGAYLARRCRTGALRPLAS
ncbi:MAG: hypothetical protein V3V08_22125 [Nannocystaceae bacterium]